MPDSRPRSASPRTVATRPRSQPAPGRRWQRCRPNIHPARFRDRSRRSSPRLVRKAGCRRGVRSCRHGRRRSRRASSHGARDTGGGLVRASPMIPPTWPDGKPPGLVGLRAGRHSGTDARLNASNEKGRWVMPAARRAQNCLNHENVLPRY